MNEKTNHPEAIAYKRGIGVVISLCLLSLFLAGALLSVVNDMYAFVKPDTEITVELKAGMSAFRFAELLSENGVINNSVVFTIYLRSKNKSDEISELSGKWQLNAGLSYREIVKEIFY